METLISLLKKKGYHNKALNEPEETRQLFLLEEDRENVFKAIYGTQKKQHGQRVYKEYLFHLLQAEEDVKQNWIPVTIYYLLTQIKIGSLS